MKKLHAIVTESSVILDVIAVAVFSWRRPVQQSELTAEVVAVAKPDGHCDAGDALVGLLKQPTSVQNP